MADKLGARKDGSFKAVSTAPSFNKTPVGSATPPLPYPVTQDLSSSQGTVADVRLNGRPAYVLSQSTQPTCIGDAAGSVGGVKSGTVGGKVEPVKGSGTVHMGGKPAIREGDPCTLNNGNCPGVYVAGPEPPTGKAGEAKVNANPPVVPQTPAEASWWIKASPWDHGALGVASFIPGVSIVAGGADAAIYAAEGNLVEAGLSAAAMVPGGKVATTAGKAVKGAMAAAKGTDKAIDAGKAVKAADQVHDATKATKLVKEAKPAPHGTSEAPKPSGSKGNGVKIAKGKSREIGKCGEWLAKMDMAEQGFDQIVSVQNNSGHGSDLVGRNSKTGEVKVWEVKSTTTDRAPPLSKEQAKLGGADYTKDRLGRAAQGRGNYGKVPEAIANARKAFSWMQDAKKRSASVLHEKREVFVGDIDAGCTKHPTRRSRSMPWSAKG